jgi:hypothetical protein
MAQAMHDLNYLHVIVVGVIGYLIGWIWFSLLFGRVMKAEMKCDTPADGSMPRPNMAGKLLASLIATLVSTWGLALLIESHGTLGRRHGAEFGLAVGILIVGARFKNDAVWSKPPCRLFAVKIFYEIVLFAVQGAILGVWR